MAKPVQLNPLPASLDSEAQKKEVSVSALLALVGKRVRLVRENSGLSRRVLSEKSGVSQRYLAQLESGGGNISIGLLKQVAIALDQSIESLFIEDNETATEASRIAERYQNADEETRARIRQILDPDQHHARKAERICLVGLRGAGKSTLGALVSTELKLDFLELNDQIEESAGMPVSEIIALYGPEGYRELEARNLNSIIESRDRLVLAVAGGVVLNSDTFTKLLSRFNTIWIKASPDEHMERVRAQGDLRPMADNPEAMVQLQQILASREARYQQADYQLDTTGKSLNNSLAELKQLITSHALLSESSDQAST